MNTTKKRPVVESFEPTELVRGSDFVPFVIRGSGFDRYEFPQFMGPCWMQEWEVVSETEIRGRVAVDGRESDERVRLVIGGRGSYIDTGVDIAIVGEPTYDPYLHFELPE